MQVFVIVNLLAHALISEESVRKAVIAHCSGNPVGGIISVLQVRIIRVVLLNPAVNEGPVDDFIVVVFGPFPRYHAGSKAQRSVRQAQAAQRFLVF